MPWTIDGAAVTADGVSLTPRSLSVSFTVEATDISTWRAYDTSGDYSRIGQYGGDWRLVDDADRASQTTISPPAAFKPPLDDVTGYVQSYTESQVAPDRIQVDIGVERDGARRDVYPAPAEGDLIVPSGETESIAAGERESYLAADIDGTLDLDGTLVIGEAPTAWTISTTHGQLALTERQVSPAEQRGSTTGGQWAVTLGLTDQQAGAIADAAGIPDAVVDRDVPSGSDTTVDTSPDDRQTITIDAPARAALPSGDYLVADWSLTTRGWTPDRRWTIELTLQET